MGRSNSCPTAARFFQKPSQETFVAAFAAQQYFATWPAWCSLWPARRSRRRRRAGAAVDPNRECAAAGPTKGGSPSLHGAVLADVRVAGSVVDRRIVAIAGAAVVTRARRGASAAAGAISGGHLAVLRRLGSGLIERHQTIVLIAASLRLGQNGCGTSGSAQSNGRQHDCRLFERHGTFSFEF